MNLAPATDARLAHLTTLSRRESLKIDHAQTTSEGAVELKRALSHLMMTPNA
jgi:hypothetical protein